MLLFILYCFQFLCAQRDHTLGMTDKRFWSYVRQPVRTLQRVSTPWTLCCLGSFVYSRDVEGKQRGGNAPEFCAERDRETASHLCPASCSRISSLWTTNLTSCVHGLNTNKTSGTAAFWPSQRHGWSPASPTAPSRRMDSLFTGETERRTQARKGEEGCALWLTPCGLEMCVS